jgi:hypothetical protein
LGKKVGLDIIDQAMSHLSKEERLNIDGWILIERLIFHDKTIL